MRTLLTPVRKYLPKITKRDKVVDSIVFYRAVVNGELTPCFKTKLQLIEGLQEKFKQVPFRDIIVQKVILQTIKN